MANSGQSASNLVSEYLRGKIVAGDLPSGVWLRAEAIAAELSVSRMPVREALHRLESEGYVTWHQNRGWMVAPLSVEDIEEIYLMRVALEELGARLGAARVTENDLARMEALAQQMEGFLVGVKETGSPESLAAFLEADMEFHDILWTAAGRTSLRHRIHALRRSSQRYLNVLLTLPGTTENWAVEHRTILRACAMHDPEMVAQCAVEHLEDSARRVARHFQGRLTSQSFVLTSTHRR